MSWVGGNRFLSLAEMKINATYIWGYLGSLGWSLNSVCGMLGNMQTESTINPSIWQNLDAGNLNLGYGLVQWTKAPKYIDWCYANGLDYTQMDSNLARILYEVEQNIQWGENDQGQQPPYDFYGFTQSQEDPYTLGMNFLYFYERPSDQNQPFRGTQAQYWWEYLEGTDPPDPPDPPITVRKMPIYYYLRRF